MPTVRNPLSSFLITTLAASTLTFLASLGTLFLGYMEFRLFYLGLVFFAMGFVAGRAAYLGFIGFIGGFIGGFVGLYAFLGLFWVLPWYWFWTLILGFSASCGLGGTISAKLMNRRFERVFEAAPKTRRCQRCGAKVGSSARKCWDCKAPLPM